MAGEYKIVRRVEFGDTDMAGIVHHAVFFRYMEAAETAFFRSLGLSLASRRAKPPIGWPRVHCECDFFAPLQFEDEVEIHLLVAKKKSKSLTYVFRLYRLQGEERREVARGLVVTVCVTALGSRMKATKIPKAIADQIQAVPARRLA
jgi:YbgC/YbaW family acyl-CoA thioester hydrolase